MNLFIYLKTRFSPTKGHTSFASSDKKGFPRLILFLILLASREIIYVPFDAGRVELSVASNVFGKSNIAEAWNASRINVEWKKSSLRL